MGRIPTDVRTYYSTGDGKEIELIKHLIYTNQYLFNPGFLFKN